MATDEGRTSHHDIAARRASFLDAGQEYERARPDYPREAVVWALGETSKRVADLGCGPGKLTAQLAALGHEVVGIDPSPTMLEIMSAKGISGVCAVAEALPLADESVDVVTVATAFHWFDDELAVPEMARVLRPGGRALILWNFRDERPAWASALSEMMGSEDALISLWVRPDSFETDVAEKLTRAGAFESVEYQTFPHAQEVDVEGLVALVASRSYIAILADDERHALLARVRRLCREHPDLAGRATFTVPYVTRAFRATTVAA